MVKLRCGHELGGILSACPGSRGGHECRVVGSKSVPLNLICVNGSVCVCWGKTEFFHIVSNKSNISIPLPCSKMGLNGRIKCQVSVKPANKGIFPSPMLHLGPKRHLAGRRKMINYGVWLA